nr:MAG TPA: hypothetical protein [Caudoviricetes sp.]
MNAIERIWRIGQTGDVNDPQELSPVENIMRNYQLPKASANMAGTAQAQNQPTDNSMWGKFKNFAGSKGGRMVLGGLGTAAAVGLTGGGLGDALGYGVIGAGNTANTIYNKEQDALGWLEKEKERQARLSDAKASRDEAWRRLEATLQAQKDARQAQYDNAVNVLNLNRDLKQKDYERGREWLLDNSDLDDDTRKKALQSLDAGYYGVTLPNADGELERRAQIAQKGNLMLDPEALNRGEIRYINKPLSGNAGLYQWAVDNWNKLSNEQRQAFNLKTVADEADLYNQKAGTDFGYNAVMEGIKTDNNIRAHGANAGVDFRYKEQGANNQLDRDMTMKGYEAGLAEDKAQSDFYRDLTKQSYINQLPDQKRQQIHSWGAAQGLNPMQSEAVWAEMEMRKNEADLAQLEASTAKTQAETNKASRPDLSTLQAGVNNGTISADMANQEFGKPIFQAPPSFAEKELAKQQVKDKASQEKSAKQVADMMPRVLGAIDRAYTALDDGTGLGQMGGLWWTNKKGGENRANVQNAQAQINTLMRGILSAMGVGATEMNSAAEAAAYRYMIDPAMPESQIKQVFDNFKQDYASGALMQDLQSIANAYGGQNTATGADTVRMETPDGQIVFVPREEVDEAISHGGRIA